MRLTDAQVAQFRDQGYLVVPQFFDQRELQALRQELTRIHDDLRQRNKLRNVAVQDDGTENQIDGEKRRHER